MDLTLEARQHVRRCLGRFSKGISDPYVRREAKRQGRYWVKAITGTGNIDLLDRDECLLVIQVALDSPHDCVEQAILAVNRTSRWRPVQRKRGPYKRDAYWKVDEE